MMRIRIAFIISFILVFGLLAGFHETNAASPTPKPTPTPTENQLANRLEKGKTTATAQVKRRESTLQAMTGSLGKRKTQILEADRSEISAMLTDMQSQFPQWRSDIQASTTIDALKSLQLANIQKTRVYLVFQPKIRLLIRLAIYNKSVAQINKRIQNLEASFANKYNNPNNNKFERAQKNIDAINTAFSDISALLAQTKTDILALTPDLYNNQNADFKAKRQSIQKNLVMIKQKISVAFNLINNTRELLNTIRNVTPTPTP